MNVLLNWRPKAGPVRQGLRLAACVMLTFWATQLPGFGKHIYGGDLNLQAATRPGYFTLTLTLYLDQANATPDSYEREIQLFIFRKRDHAPVGSPIVRQTNSQPVRYDNQACADLRNLSVLAMNYRTDLYLDPAVYNDPAGYYIVWDRCCRSADISNIQNPGEEGMLFYMEFPPVQRNGTAFTNSSPQFSFPNGEYICVNKPFVLNFGATDRDGDQLRYSLVTPLAGYTDNSGQNTVGDGSSHITYPEVAWLPGFSATNSIPGRPPLRIDPQTGQLSVTATQVGLFIFAVLCEEYRNGIRIGAVRREFQMPVVDCGNRTPPRPLISYNNVETQELSFCEGTTVTLSTETNPLWSYQWQRNGFNIADATSPVLTVTEPGDYAVVKSFATTCGNDTTSRITQVRSLPLPTVKITPEKEPRICEGESLVLTIKPETGITYQWTVNGALVPGATNASLRVTQSGRYGILATSGSTCTNRDSLAVMVNPTPKATLTSSASAICQDGEVRLETTGGTAYRYEWYLNNTVFETGNASTTAARVAGTYQVRVTDGNGCQGLSDLLTLAIIPRPDLRFDTVAPICVTQTEPLWLEASPSGGVFSGPGITANRFDPARAGAGLHTIVYTYRGTSPCPTAISRQIRVESPARVDLPERVSVLMGNTVLLKPTVQGEVSRYTWEPPAYLSDPASASPTANPPVPTLYTLTVRTPAGCQTEKTVQVDVLKQMFMADVFSPNNDGINDQWDIRNTDQFPGCEILVYNRWGEVVFYSNDYKKPWDGTYQNQKVQAGIYQYLIKTHQPQLPEYRGTVLVLY
ncbi:hypothetical protein GCM10027347_02760 [Larkinella harenae]